jgi:hypothetical protein
MSEWQMTEAVAELEKDYDLRDVLKRWDRRDASSDQSYDGRIYRRGLFQDETDTKECFAYLPDENFEELLGEVAFHLSLRGVKPAPDAYYRQCRCYPYPKFVSGLEWTEEDEIAWLREGRLQTSATLHGAQRRTREYLDTVHAYVSEDRLFPLGDGACTPNQLI